MSVPSSFPALDAPKREVRFAPINGLRQFGPACPTITNSDISPE